MLAFTSPQAPPSAERIDAEESNAAGLRVRGFTAAAALVSYITFRSRPQHTVLRSRRRLPAGLKRRREAERRPIENGREIIFFRSGGVFWVEPKRFLLGRSGLQPEVALFQTKSEKDGIVRSPGMPSGDGGGSR